LPHLVFLCEIVLTYYKEYAGIYVKLLRSSRAIVQPEELGILEIFNDLQWESVSGE
jgi:hypothetical protein